MFHELQFPDTPIGLTKLTAWKSLADMAKAAGREPPIPDLLLDRDDRRNLNLVARAHAPAESKLRAAEHRAGYAASVVSRFARDAALSEPEPETPAEDLKDLADAKKALADVEHRLTFARQTANRGFNESGGRGDPRPWMAEVEALEKERKIVDDWVRAAESRVKNTEARRSRFANRFSTHWGRLSAAELAKVEQRFKELRTKVGEFLQECCLELVELHYLRAALESSSAPLACDRDDMPAGYVSPDAEAAEDDEETVAEGDDEEADAEDEHAPEDVEDEDEELVATAPPSATTEPESAATVEERRKKVLALHAGGMSGRAIAKELGLHQTQVQRVLKAAEPPPQVIQAVTTVDRFANSTIRTVRAEGQPAAT